MTLAGVWENDYGSRMTLAVSGDGRVRGIYASTTGSTGEYVVIGCQQAAEPTPRVGQPVALAIAWRSIAGGSADPSWNWSSGLSGQISLRDGEELLVLTHALVASSGFPGLCDAGTHIDRLTYRRVADRPAETLDGPGLPAPQANPLSGTWRSSDDTTLLMIEVHPCCGNLVGRAQGKLMLNGGIWRIDGVTDINALRVGLALQSTGIAALPGGARDAAIAFAGCLDLQHGELTLLGLSSQSTPPAATYVQTAVMQRTFRRLGDVEEFDKLSSARSPASMFLEGDRRNPDDSARPAGCAPPSFGTGSRRSRRPRSRPRPNLTAVIRATATAEAAAPAID